MYNLQTSLEKLGFHLPVFGIDSKFGPETFGASQRTITSISRITNLSEIVNDPSITEFNQDGLTKTQYNIIIIVGQNQQMIDQIRAKLGPEPQSKTEVNTAPQVGSAGEKSAYDFFVSKGYTPIAASGIAANLKTESSFKVTAVGDGGKARSLAQWHPDRYTALTKQGFNLMDFGSALAAIDYELKHDYPNVYNMMQKASSPEEAAKIFDEKFERSAGLTTNTRMKDAARIYSQYA